MCIKWQKATKFMYAFYMHHILLMGNDLNLLNSIKEYLNSKFSMKDLGEAAYILGIKIYRDRSRRLIALNQTTYIDKMLSKYSMDNAKKCSLPILKGRKLSKTQCPVTDEEIENMKDVPYASAVGSIMYAMLCTCPDVALAISMVGRFQSNPGKEHWMTVKGILKYLKRTKDMSLVYGGIEE